MASSVWRWRAEGGQIVHRPARGVGELSTVSGATSDELDAAPPQATARLPGLAQLSMLGSLVAFGSIIERTGIATERLGNTVERFGNIIERTGIATERLGNTVERFGSIIERTGIATERLGSLSDSLSHVGGYRPDAPFDAGGGGDTLHDHLVPARPLPLVL